MRNSEYKEKYETAVKMLEMYQDDLIPKMRKELEQKVEVVRCENCLNWNRSFSSGCKEFGNYTCACEEWSNPEDGYMRYTKPDDYCSYGEME